MKINKKHRIITLGIILMIFFSCQKSKVIGNQQHIEVNDVISEDNSTKPLFAISEGKYSPEMIFVEGGKYIMGNESKKTNQPHPVYVSSFYIAKFMATNEIWKKFLNEVKLEYIWDWDDDMGFGPFYNIVPSDNCPAQGLNWYYAVVFCNWASMKDGLEQCYILDRLPENIHDEIEVEWNKEANGYRLPTEAEWEYAARGGSKSKGYTYPGSNIPEEIGKFGLKASYPVGLYKPNELGIHDMGGNADEWCWDWYDEIMFEWLPIENPSVDKSADVKKKASTRYDSRVLRGNSWIDREAREIALRGAYPPKNIGFIGIRLVRNAG